MSERLRQRLGGARGWLLPVALLALAPKCILCALAYAGLGSALGLRGPELCGASDATGGLWITWLPELAGVAAAGSCLARRLFARHFPSRPS